MLKKAACLLFGSHLKKGMAQSASNKVIRLEKQPPFSKPPQKVTFFGGNNTPTELFHMAKIALGQCDVLLGLGGSGSNAFVAVEG